MHCIIYAQLWLIWLDREKRYCFVWPLPSNVQFNIWPNLSAIAKKVWTCGIYFECIEMLLKTLNIFCLCLRSVISEDPERVKHNVMSSFWEKIHYKDWGPKKVTIYFPIFYLVKISENILLFIYILPGYVAHEITKEFWKSSHFENITAGFLLRCHNTLRWNTPEKMHFQEWIFLFSPILPIL